ncbi:hypothetical protein CORC01_11599 [Colletotrichum orchidophilum]|uniref:Uncharacterized protein n=1 Tax=Colletotrichum orchidophilum TaxID=1209926 RepID=A0A1G4AVB0_9PEZI|nr:uncharacterized protein CORC01_11599 [Colletotrichum orchidophilum]OHE93110.1 hypothetical protein CORC01_11599 [Colletotrichum orchidophilum]
MTRAGNKTAWVPGMRVCFASDRHLFLGSDVSEVTVPSRANLQVTQAPDVRNAKAPGPFCPSLGPAFARRRQRGGYLLLGGRRDETSTIIARTLLGAMP